MSKYTTEVRFICETLNHLSESAGYTDVNTIIENAIPSIFDFDFPIFDENYRNVLCTKIIRHYYTREIGFETVGLWKLKLQTKLNEIMPYYNQLYSSELIKFNPLYDVDLKTTNIGNKDSRNNKDESRQSTGHETTIKQGSAKTDSNSGSFANSKNKSDADSNRSVVSDNSDNATHYDLFSETPQGGITGLDTGTYLTDARKINDTKNNRNINFENSADKANSESESNAFSQDKSENQYSENNAASNSVTDRTTGADTFISTENYLNHVIGKNAGSSYSKLLMEFRDTFLNIDLDVIDSLSDLFINLW